MQVRGLDTGAANALTFGETGTTFGLTTPANTVQTAKDAQLTIDGFTVTRPTNQITGALQGVTLALTEKTTTAATLRVEPSESQLSGKLQAVVDAYNAVVKKVQTTAGNGSIKAQETALAGDSTLRGLTSRMTNAVLTETGSGNVKTLASIGLSLNRDGTLSLNATKLSQALAADASAVTKVLAGTDGSSDGVMDLLSGVADVYNQTGTGLIALKKDALTTRAQSLGKQVDRENERLERYADALRKQFTAMDGSVAANRSELSYLTGLYSG
jgi:flagellar hook-associated protein 2